MKRKLLSLVLVAAMLASMLVFAPTSGAAVNTTTAEVAVTDATVKAGGTVTLDVIVTTEKVNSFDLGFRYDATKLELVTWSKGGAELPATALGVFVDDAILSSLSDKGLVGFSSGTAVAVDASAGLKIATITFNVKAGATPGDTYVEFSNANGLYIRPTDDPFDKIQGNDLTTKAGKITILPAGYSEVASWVEVTDFTEDNDYTDNGDGTCTIDGYYGEYAEQAIALKLPEYINGLKVTQIARRAFRNSSGYTAIMVPATVTNIAQQAFDGIDTCMDFYWLYEGDDATLGASIYTTENGTVHGYAGSSAEWYADDEGLAFVEYAVPTTLTYTVGSETYTYAVGNSTTAPGSAVVDGEVIVAWNDGVNYIAPGASMTIAESTTLTPVTISAPVTQNGADVKVGATADDFALRFTSKLAIADYEALFALDEDVKLGMLITPQKYVDYSVAFTKADLGAWAVSQGAAASAAYVDVAINGYYEKDAVDYTLAGSLKGFSGATRAKNPTFAAIAYAEITIGGNVVTVYGSYDKACGRDAKTVLSALSAAGTLATTEQGWLDTLIGKFD